MAKRTTVVLICALAVALSGCPSTKKKGGAGADDGTGTGALGEEGLAGSSLSRAQKGLRPEEDGILKDVRFGYDGSEVRRRARSAGAERRMAARQPARQDRARRPLRQPRHDRVQPGLGAKRAKTVKDILMGQGIGAERISTISYGKELPLCQEESEDCWARNRRVHFVILK
jgi:peptidoglycan-associated lipoprotein